nr:magnesium and cobalt transport protein CorA [Cellulomonas sp. JH27-2]
MLTVSDAQHFSKGPSGWHDGDDGEPRWIVVGPGDLVEYARARGVSEQAIELLEHHTPGAHPERSTHPLRGHVDQSADGEIILSAPTLSYVAETRDVHTGALTLILADGVILTSEAGDAGILPRTAEKLCSGVPIPDSGVAQVLAAILLTLVAHAADVEAELGDAVADTERVVFSTARVDDPVERIYDLKREIAEARRALAPITGVLPQLGAETIQRRRKEKEPPKWLGRVQATADRVDHHLDAHDELLDAMLQVHLSQVSVQQNEDMRKISAWAAIAAVPTLIAGIYGMNFQHMPELTWTWGYPAVVVVMLGICGGLYRQFRKVGWL